MMMKLNRFNLLSHFCLCSGSRMALTPVTPAVTPCPAQLPAGATATATNGTKWGPAEDPAATRVTRNPMAWEEGATSREPRPTAASTPARTAPLTTPTRTPTTAAPPRCWLRAGAETAGSGRHLRGTVRPREAAGCSRDRPPPRSLPGLLEKGAWIRRVEAHPLTSWLETAVPTV